ncbi:helix-turn-helix domain-containing protein [Micromonospora sp. CPCC 206060]|uniref:winged helix-turn-helix transcriptional regulator n=1 Tax=Micromonospora sp. CPCC 206060 TaxID=3122406 RepID=UPI002FF206BB
MRPVALDWSVENCTIARAMEILGERWTLVVLREVFNGVRRFDDMRVRTNVPRQVLTNRLATLVDRGVLRREPYREPGARLRHEYRLTAMGMDLWPVLVAVLGWGDRYLADPDGSPLVVRHADCDGPVRAVLRCADGHDVTELREIRPAPGPGARRRTD